MKNEEAIEILKTLIPKTCKMVNGRLKGGFDNTDCIEFHAIQTAVNALEKQIPEKPVAFKRTAYNFETGICPYSHYKCEHIKPYNHEDEYTDYKCPSCNKRLSDGMPGYCWHCGQALDWSDEE